MRVIRVWSSAVLAIALMAAAAFGQDNVMIGSASGMAGSEVTVEVNASSASNLGGMEITLTFDQTALQIKAFGENGITQGSDAQNLPFVSVGEPEVTAANSSGEISITMIDLSGEVYLDAGNNLNLVDIVFEILESASAGTSPISITSATLSDDQGADLTITTTDGAVTITDGGMSGENSIWVTNVNGAVGGTSTMRVKATSDQDIHAAQFDLLFDQTVLQIPSGGITLGNDAKSLSVPVLGDEELASANLSGKLVVFLIDLNSDPESDLGKVAAGEERDLLAVKFAVSSEASEGEQTVSLANVSLAHWVQDTTTTEIEVVNVTAGTLTIGAFAPGDVSGDGKVNIFDLLDLLKALKGQTTVGPSDVNGDGKVNIFDLLELLKLMKQQ